MRRAVLVALLLAAVVGVTAFVAFSNSGEQRDADPRVTTTGSSTPTSSHAPAPTSRPAPVHALPPMPAPPPPMAYREPALEPSAASPSLPGTAVSSDVAKRMTVARDALLAAVDPCWDDPGPPATSAGAPDATVQKLRVTYRLVVADGEAHAADVEPLDSSISDPRMDRCLLDRIRAAHWASPGPDASLTVRDVIILGDIAMRRRPKGPT